MHWRSNKKYWGNGKRMADQSAKHLTTERAETSLSTERDTQKKLMDSDLRAPQRLLG